jgi:hypothetical protein
MEDTKTITLIKAVQLGDPAKGGILYDHIDLSEPTAGQLEKASRADTPIGVAVSLIALNGGIPRAAVERFCQRDMQQCHDFLESFQQPAPATGSTSSQS